MFLRGKGKNSFLLGLQQPDRCRPVPPTVQIRNVTGRSSALSKNLITWSLSENPSFGALSHYPRIAIAAEGIGPDE